MWYTQNICTGVCAHAEARKEMLGVDSLETGSLTETEELHLLGRQVASKLGLSGLCPHHHTALHSFTWVLGTRTQVFTVKQKAHYSLSYPLIPYHISQTNYFIKEQDN